MVRILSLFWMMKKILIVCLFLLSWIFFTACGKILIHAFVIDITDNTYIDVRGKQSDLSKFIEDFDLTLDDLEIDDPNDNGQIFLKQFESLDEFEKYMPTNAPEIVSKEADNILNDRLAASIYGNLK